MDRATTATPRPRGSKEVLSPMEASRHLSVVSMKTLANWRSLGIGPTYLRLGDGARSRVAYRRQDLDRWLEGHLVVTEPGTGE